MKTKKSTETILVLFVSACLMICSGNLFAQNTGNKNGDPEKKEKIKAMKVAYISQMINLNTAEAEKFWPLYNEFQDKREGFQKEHQKKMKIMKTGKIEELTEEQADEIINSELQKEQKQLDLKKEYYPKFKNVIGSRKMVGVYKAEKEFNRMLLEKLKGNGPKPGLDD
ncbi:MAG TPA: hypothetical protein PLI16_03680 [Bacteroidales bacterium]|nr:hypothetical protein [Bacteroidales bacterium]